ncbi:sugar transferase [Bacillus sp. V59.32b]|uniref:sugar transferase n=1 Tax=Bacillus sp. V59.32b TaxID=1758642 RepID=UPI000E3CB335|nr:sugar transferase [Bacillus sp. V59.32b]RFU67435.1 sugar transferase [Bacillus sp. V59.32b]
MNSEKVYNIYHDYPIVEASNTRLSKHALQYLYIKRGIDIVLAGIGFLLSLPIILVFALLIVLETPGSPFYFQDRLGKNGKTFKIIKLRSMRIDAEKEGAKWAAKEDCRVTKVGKFIRKTRIDELPQLLLVLKGDMSIVGPRPERPVFAKQFSKEIKGFENRLLVKPGLTGLAQVNGGYNITPKEKLRYDLEYIKNLAFVLELKIILKTFKILFTGEGAR